VEHALPCDILSIIILVYVQISFSLDEQFPSKYIASHLIKMISVLFFSIGSFKTCRMAPRNGNQPGNFQLFSVLFLKKNFSLNISNPFYRASLLLFSINSFIIEAILICS